jgi:hypothetical protein
MIEINWNPERQQLKSFGLLCLAMCLGLGVLRAWRAGAFASALPIGWHGPWALPVALWTIGAAAGLLAIVAPLALRPIFVGGMVAAYPISWVVSHVLLGVTYFGLFTVIASIFRLIGRDELHRVPDKHATTYWEERKPAPGVARYFKQF